jgi:hypothetical protein
MSKNTIYVIQSIGGVNSLKEGVVSNDNEYFIPTLDESGNYVPLEKFRGPTRRFIDYAKKNLKTTFIVDRIGCVSLKNGKLGYDDFDMAPFFSEAPQNVILPVGWRTFFQDIKNKS